MLQLEALSKATRIRLPKIKRGLIDRQTEAEIAERCHVHRVTISRDIQKWTQTPDFEIWLKEVWLNEYKHVSHDEAFRQITKLLTKTLTAKIRAKLDITERVQHDVTINVTEDEDEILSKAARILERKAKSPSIH